MGFLLDQAGFAPARLQAAAGQRDGVQQGIGGGNQPASGRQFAEQDHFFAGGHLTAAEAASMGQTHVHQHAEVGRQDPGDARHLAGSGDAGLEHPQFRASGGGEHGQRHPHLAVPAAGAGGDPVALGQQGRQRALDDRLAIAAGDRHHLADVLPAIPGRQALQGFQRIVDFDPGQLRRACSRGGTPAATHHHQTCPRCDRVGHEAVAIAAAPPEGEEGIARLHPPRIDGHRPDRSGRRITVELACQQSGQRAGGGEGH